MAIIFINTEEQLKEALRNDLIPYLNQKSPLIALDLETYTVHPAGLLDEVEIDMRPIEQADGTFSSHIRTLQIGLDPNNALSIGGKQFVIDVKILGYQLVRKYLKKFLESVITIGHNIKYDYQFCYVLLDIDLPKMFDTMLMSQVYFAGAIKNHSLGDLYKNLLDYAWFTTNAEMDFEAYRDFKHTNQTKAWGILELSQEDIRYAADDVYYIFYCFDELRRRILEWEKVYEKKFKSTEKGIRAVIKLECELIPLYALMELRGVYVDVEYHKTVIDILEKEKEKAAEALNLDRKVEVKRTNGKRGKEKVIWFEEVVQPINPNSPAQLKPALEFLLSTDLKSKVILEGTGEDILKRYLNTPKLYFQLSEVTRDTLETVLNYKKASSLLSKFGAKLLKQTTDRNYVHPSWFQIGSDENMVVTGRSSCKNPNFQQQPSRGQLFIRKDFKGYSAAALFRTAFAARLGWKLVCSDFSQIEARIAAAYCGQKDLVERFNKNDIDIYGAIAKAMLNLDYEPTKDHPSESVRYQRDYIGKTAGLSILYGTHWKSLKGFMFDKTNGKINWNDEEAESAHKSFFNNFPNFRIALDSYRSKVKELPEEAGQTLLPFTKRKNGELIPYFVSQSAGNIKRHRRFVLKAEHLHMDEYKLAARAEKTIGDDGRVRNNLYFSSLSSAVREGFNQTIQGANSIVLKLAALKVSNEMKVKGYEDDEGIIALVHDEILMHVREERAEEAKELLERNMLEAAKEIIPEVYIPAKANIGNNWYEAK